MASRELSILVNAKGALQAARNIGKVDSSIGRLGKHAQRGLANTATNLTRLGIVAGGFVAANVVKGVQSLEDLERVTNATEGVITSTGGAAGVTAEQVRKLAEQLESVTTADDKAIQGGENLLLTFTGIGRDAFPRATAAMTNMAIAMAGGNVEAANFETTAIQVGKALNDPITGITALRKAGVSFTDQQKQQIKTLVKSGKTTEAQAIILGELEKEFGKAGEAAGRGFGADMRRAKDAIEGAQQALAVGFLPIIKEASSFLSTELAKPETIAKIRKLGEDLAGGFRKAIEFAKNIPWSAIGDAMKLAGAGAKAALDFFLQMPPWIQTAVVSGWGLNKLTGGALGSIVGELGKGLIKGVLGMNAAVVNINAGTVNGAGTGSGAATGGGGLASKLGVVGPAGVAAGAMLDLGADARARIHAFSSGKLTKVQPAAMSPDERQSLRAIVAGGHSDRNAIVTAIRGIRLPAPKVFVSVRNTATSVTRSGQTLVRTRVGGTALI